MCDVTVVSIFVFVFLLFFKCVGFFCLFFSDEAVTLPKPLIKAVLDDFHLLFQFYYVSIFVLL